MLEKIKKLPWIGMVGIVIDGVALALCFVPLAASLQLGLVFGLLTLGSIFTVADYLKVKSKITEFGDHLLVGFEFTANCLLLVGLLCIGLIFSVNIGGPVALAIIMLNIVALGSYTVNLNAEEASKKVEDEAFGLTPESDQSVFSSKVYVAPALRRSPPMTSPTATAVTATSPGPSEADDENAGLLAGKKTRRRSVSI